MSVETLILQRISELTVKIAEIEKELNRLDEIDYNGLGGIKKGLEEKRNRLVTLRDDNESILLNITGKKRYVQ